MSQGPEESEDDQKSKEAPSGDSSEPNSTETSQESQEEQQQEQQKKPQPPKAETPAPPAQPPRPVVGTPRPLVGTPIGTPPRPTVGTPIGTPRPPTPVGSQKPSVGTPVASPTVGTPVGTPAAKPAPQVGTPVARPTVGTPVGTPVGRPGGTTPLPPRPGAPATVAGGKPTLPPKPRVESKTELTRRRFLLGLAIAGGIVALAQFGQMGPFLTSSVSGGATKKQQIFDALSGGTTPLTLTNPGQNDWKTFIYPQTGNPNVDSDTFKQCVLIHLPKGFTAPSNLSYKDPKTGDYYVGFSRVCVHLWCLWNYFPTDMRMECPCHGSQYVPGTGQYSVAKDGATLAAKESNQPPGLAVAGPASLQVPPNNQLPIVLVEADANGNFFATGVVGQIGCGQNC